MANLAPYVNHAYSVLRLSRGLPIPVKCCWNGLAIFDAEPVQYGGIRFRCVRGGRCCLELLQAPGCKGMAAYSCKQLGLARDSCPLLVALLTSAVLLEWHLLCL